MVIKIEKRNCMIVLSSQQRKKHIDFSSFDFKLNATRLDLVSCPKILGLNIHCNLNWHEHGKLESVWILMQKFYFTTLILSPINFCLNIWGTCSKFVLTQVYKL